MKKILVFTSAMQKWKKFKFPSPLHEKVNREKSIKLSLFSYVMSSTHFTENSDDFELKFETLEHKGSEGGLSCEDLFLG